MIPHRIYTQNSGYLSPCCHFKMHSIALTVSIKSNTDDCAVCILLCLLVRNANVIALFSDAREEKSARLFCTFAFTLCDVPSRPNTNTIFYLNTQECCTLTFCAQRFLYFYFAVYVCVCAIVVVVGVVFVVGCNSRHAHSPRHKQRIRKLHTLL